MDMDFSEDDIVIPGVRPQDVDKVDKDPIGWMMNIAQNKAIQAKAKASAGNKSTL